MASKYFYISLAQNFSPSKMDMWEHKVTHPFFFFMACFAVTIFTTKTNTFLGAISVKCKAYDTRYKKSHGNMKSRSLVYWNFLLMKSKVDH